jgi:tripartite-type tricarboxylate transporter receptor subunit TctC
MGATDYMQMEVFRKVAGLDWLTVRFNGAAPALQSIYAGDGQFTYTTVGLLKPLQDAGKMRMIAVMGANRSALSPEIPTVVEAAPPSMKAAMAEMVKVSTIGSVFGLAGPAKLPQPVVNTLYEASIKVTKDPEFVKRMADFGLNTLGSTPAEYQQKIRDDMARWKRLAADLKYEPQ